LNRPPQSLPKAADSSPAVLSEADPVRATVLARIDLNGAFALPSQLLPVEVLRRPFEFTQYFGSLPQTLRRGGRATADGFRR
jgi:hypothetical protein